MAFLAMGVIDADPGNPAPDDPDVAVPQRAPPHEPPIPVKEPLEPDTPADSPIKA